MTAQQIGVFTILFPDPYAITYENNEFLTLNSSVAFQYRILSNIQTLSTKGIDSANDPYGILYVPDLQSDACREQEKDHVPANATRLADLPLDKNYALIAVAPWYAANCTMEYFTSARLSPTKAFFTYQLGQGNAMPPVLRDSVWDLHDGGMWQSNNFFPTYALSSITGQNIMDQLDLYSGNISSVPNGPQLLSEYNSTDYVRLWATVNTDSGAALPSLWVFLVIVLAVLIVAVGITSLAMHIIQRRRRNALRDRVLDGQVDLEALGVKRLTVSQQILDKLPIYTYMEGSQTSGEKPVPAMPTAVPSTGSPSVEAETGHKPSPIVRRASAPTVSTSDATSTSWSQSTCPICLDDFEPNETKVRELPCRHVFHPDCIDTFLLRNSSLCPMCKQSVLPKGDCSVKITNVMVRRERHINRMRVRNANGQTSAPFSHMSPSASTAHSRPTGALGSLGSRIGGAMAGRRIFSAPERTQPRLADIEMANTTTSPPVASSTTPQQEPTSAPAAANPSTIQDCSPTHNRREWARQRALAMLGPRHTPPSDIDLPPDEEDTGPRWRRTLRKVFPGFR
ncbi:hypothetical protein ACN47E_005544 [Coniothyrium glycines]